MQVRSSSLFVTIVMAFVVKPGCWTKLPASHAASPSARRIENAESRDDVSQCFLAARNLHSLSDRAWTKDWLDAAIGPAIAQPAPEPLSSLLAAFRAVRCPDQRSDLVAEAVALTWTWWLRLRRRGKHSERFVSAIATYAARAARSGRRLCGQEKAGDVLSPLAQRLHGFCVGTLPSCRTPSGNAFSDALRDNMRTPPDEQVCCRLDFPAWVAGYGERDRRIIAVMLLGERTQLIARRFSVSAARVSQLRRQFCSS